MEKGLNLLAAFGSVDMEERQRYYSYVLRVWLAGDRDQLQWHASLEDTRTSERRGFASLAALCDYLNQQTGQACEQEHNPQERRES